MLRYFSIRAITSGILSSAILSGGIVSLGGCQNNSKNLPQKSSSHQAINQLNRRVEKLESQILLQIKKTRELKDKKAPSGPIKSITFRIGTKDDRLRIYWEDGSNSDLPCTKEQSIWACG